MGHLHLFDIRIHATGFSQKWSFQNCPVMPLSRCRRPEISRYLRSPPVAAQRLP